MAYYLDLFTAQTWEEFRSAGANTSGFSDRNQAILNRIKSGDVLLCYMVGVQRWVGALEVLGPSNNKAKIWSVQDFPARFRVKPILMAEPEYGLPMEQLEGKVSFYKDVADKGKFKGFVRMSPNPFRSEADGKVVMQLLTNWQANHIHTPVDPKKLAYLPRFTAEIKHGKTLVPVAVTVPPPENGLDADEASATSEEVAPSTKHTAIQYDLLRLGAELGFEVWVAKNDRSKVHNGVAFSNLPSLVVDLPTQFNEATTNTISYIDVLWLKGNSIVAAFEVESTTSVYSGLLRMSDLLSLQPNLAIDLYIVAPTDRRSKVEQEILRPTFRLRDKPLSDTCGYISFEALTEKVEGVRRLGLMKSLKPDFLKAIAEHFGEEGID